MIAMPFWVMSGRVLVEVTGASSSDSAAVCIPCFGAGFGRRKTISLIAPLLGSMLRPIVSPFFF